MSLSFNIIVNIILCKFTLYLIMATIEDLVFKKIILANGRYEKSLTIGKIFNELFEITLTDDMKNC